MISPTSDTFLPLLQTVFTSILEVFLLCCAGYILARRGILDKKTQKQLNRLNVSLFTPSLLFSKVAFFLSPAKLAELWIIPIFFVVVTLLSMAVSFLLGWLFKLHRSQRNFAVAAAMFMNSNSLPIALMQSLVITVPGLKWGSDDNMDAMVGRALTYLVLYSTLGMMVRWSYGVRLLAQADMEPVMVQDPEDANETTLLLSGSETTIPPDNDEPQHYHRQPGVENFGGEEPQLAGGYLPAIVINDADKRHPAHKRLQQKVFHSFPNSPNQSRVDLGAIDTTSPADSSRTQSPTADAENLEDDSSLPSHHHPRSPTVPTSSRFQSFLRRSRRRLGRTWRKFNEFMTVPLWAAFLSLIVACVWPLQHAIEEHMQPLKGALASAGNCSIPLTLVVLGAYFYKPKVTSEDVSKGQTGVSTRSSGSLFDRVRGMFKRKARSMGSSRASSNSSISIMAKAEGRPGETKTVVIAILSRMIIVPLLLIPLMALSTWYGWHAVFEDPVFVVANVLLISSPPALTLAQITQAAASSDAFERLLSRTIFWSYCIVTPPATILYVVIGMMLVKM